MSNDPGVYGPFWGLRPWSFGPPPPPRPRWEPEAPRSPAGGAPPTTTPSTPQSPFEAIPTKPKDYWPYDNSSGGSPASSFPESPTPMGPPAPDGLPTVSTAPHAPGFNGPSFGAGFANIGNPPTTTSIPNDAKDGVRSAQEAHGRVTADAQKHATEAGFGKTPTTTTTAAATTPAVAPTVDMSDLESAARLGDRYGLVADINEASKLAAEMTGVPGMAPFGPADFGGRPGASVDMGSYQPSDDDNPLMAPTTTVSVDTPSLTYGEMPSLDGIAPTTDATVAADAETSEGGGRAPGFGGAFGGLSGVVGSMTAADVVRGDVLDNEAVALGLTLGEQQVAMQAALDGITSSLNATPTAPAPVSSLPMGLSPFDGDDVMGSYRASDDENPSTTPFASVSIDTPNLSYGEMPSLAGIPGVSTTDTGYNAAGLTMSNNPTAMAQSIAAALGLNSVAMGMSPAEIAGMSATAASGPGFGSVDAESGKTAFGGMNAPFGADMAFGDEGMGMAGIGIGVGNVGEAGVGAVADGLGGIASTMGDMGGGGGLGDAFGGVSFGDPSTFGGFGIDGVSTTGGFSDGHNGGFGSSMGDGSPDGGTW